MKKPTPNASDFVERIELQTQLTAQDAAGQPPTSWITVAKLWADVRYTGGLETIRAGAPAAITRVSVRIRHYPSVNAGQRLLHNGRVLHINTVQPGPRRAWIDLVCEAINAQS